MAKMTFDDDSVTLDTLQNPAYSFNTIGNICNAHGDLQFCTNGKAVFDRFGSKMPNGDSLSYPSRWYYQLGEGMASRQGALILPDLSDTDRFYIFHYTATDTILAISGGYEAFNFYYSIVDMRLNGGKGDLVQKNVPIIEQWEDG